ncbi:DUF2867 domain-containing protein [Dactylosporangium roseum]|uniref:DUF2867 domain-containing protein n=1 Tax=Dactylosporangium roseum TaxID=47989 RepID=A0ABY5Z2E3_9ACTN|nr:DUF2867 domain-containing protein [Dactylosporangium roseum]UWZ36175.1 DUF2867 domain-containing protein [Dactylosporangium roseum]
MRNVQRRTIDAPAEVVGALIDRLASPDDRVWPAHAWPPLRLDRPLRVGAVGGHGPIRYSVEEYEPGRRVRFRFDPAIGLEGHHELRVEAAGRRAVLVHELTGRATGAMTLRWPLAIRWIHEALMHDAFDNAERAATGAVDRPARWSPWVRLLRRLRVPAPRRVPLPADARLARGALDRVDLMDAWQGGRPSGASADPAAWRERMFTRPPRWVAGLMALRNRIPGLERLERRTVFAPLATVDDEILFGADTRHFDVRISLYLGPATVVCSTLARPRTRRGRMYLAVVRRVHPLVVRSMLARTVRAAPRPEPSLG